MKIFSNKSNGAQNKKTGRQTFPYSREINFHLSSSYKLRKLFGLPTTVIQSYYIALLPEDWHSSTSRRRCLDRCFVLCRRVFFPKLSIFPSQTEDGNSFAVHRRNGWRKMGTHTCGKDVRSQIMIIKMQKPNQTTAKKILIRYNIT